MHRGRHSRPSFAKFLFQFFADLGTKMRGSLATSWHSHASRGIRGCLAKNAKNAKNAETVPRNRARRLETTGPYSTDFRTNVQLSVRSLHAPSASVRSFNRSPRFFESRKTRGGQLVRGNGSLVLVAPLPHRRLPTNRRYSDFFHLLGTFWKRYRLSPVAAFSMFSIPY